MTRRTIRFIAARAFSRSVAIVFVLVASLHTFAETETSDEAQEPLTRLQKACDSRDIKEIQALIKDGADVSETDKRGRTLLHYAAYNGSLNVIDFLLAEGLDIEAKTKMGDTPLLFAVWYGEVHSAKHLISKGANVNAVDNSGYTALHVYLEDEDAPHNESILDVLVSRVSVNIGDVNGVAPLHLATQLSGGYGEETIESLLAKGADVNAQTKQGETPLDWAIRAKNPEVVKLLRDNGGTMSFEGNTPDLSVDSNREQALVLGNIGQCHLLQGTLALPVQGGKNQRHAFLCQ